MAAKEGADAFEKELDVPDGIEVVLDGADIVVRGPRGELRKTHSPEIRILIDREGRRAVISAPGWRRRQKALVGTWRAHLSNMITGVQAGWETRLKVVHSHFPVKISFENKEIVIQNFLGEKKPRRTGIIDGADVKVDKDIITVSGINKETVGQMAGRIEALTVVRGYDKRVFQDGCYILYKCRPAGPAEKAGGGG